jgi:glycosyltransferase involved in cell wall biosynthesis
MAKDLSIVIPCYNEGKNVYILYGRLKKVLLSLKKTYEIIYIDDGSRDDTFAFLEKIRSLDSNVRVVKFRKNFGQTAAFDAGFSLAEGKVIVSMDADLQNDPEDIPLLLGKMRQGFDVVCGWRADRKDPFLKKLTSKLANRVRKSFTKETIHDSGCSLRAYKKECFDGLTLYGEMHRYIPAILTWRGFKVSEVKVHHYPRQFGKTKYGAKRVLKGFLDLIVVKFWMQYSGRPMHLFGGLGFLTSFLGSLIGIYLAIMKFVYHQAIGNRPLLLLAVLLVIIGVQFIVFGILGDILIKTYYESNGKKNYLIEKIL